MFDLKWYKSIMKLIKDYLSPEPINLLSIAQINSKREIKDYHNTDKNNYLFDAQHDIKDISLYILLYLNYFNLELYNEHFYSKITNRKPIRIS